MGCLGFRFPIPNVPTTTLSNARMLHSPTLARLRIRLRASESLSASLTGAPGARTRATCLPPCPCAGTTWQRRPTSAIMSILTTLSGPGEPTRWIDRAHARGALSAGTGSLSTGAETLQYGRLTRYINHNHSLRARRCASWNEPSRCHEQPATRGCYGSFGLG